MTHSETPTSTPAPLTISDAIYAIGQLQGGLHQLFEMGLRAKKEPLIRSIDTLSQYLFLLAYRQNEFFIRHDARKQDKMPRNEFEELIEWFKHHNIDYLNLLFDAKKVYQENISEICLCPSIPINIKWTPKGGT